MTEEYQMTEDVNRDKIKTLNDRQGFKGSGFE